MPTTLNRAMRRADERLSSLSGAMGLNSPSASTVPESQAAGETPLLSDAFTSGVLKYVEMLTACYRALATAIDALSSLRDA